MVKKTTERRVYAGKLILSAVMKANLKKLLLNHLIIYNEILSNANNSYTLLETMMEQAEEFIEENNIDIVSRKALYNELRYQRTKIRNNVRSQKAIVRIQYLTFICDSGKNEDYCGIKINGFRNKITIDDVSGYMTTLDEIPELSDEPHFINISYLPSEDECRLTIYKVN